jgi:peptidoglycan/xylan/chitin deacetylase (PgdA/CDA1 family)
VLEQIPSEHVRHFRPPFGARRPVVFKIARELGLQSVLWNAMTTDWKEPSAEKIANRLCDKIDGLVKSGSAANVVMHDGGHLMQATDRGPSVKAAEMLLEQFSQKLRFVRLDSWEEV